jgi:hypothetical protein
MPDLTLLVAGAVVVATAFVFVVSLAAGGVEFEDEPDWLGGGWSDAWLLRRVVLSGAAALLATRGAGGGSGAGGRVLAGSAGRLLSTRSEKLLASCAGSGRAGFGGAF